VSRSCKTLHLVKKAPQLATNDVQKVWHLASKFDSCNCCDSWATVKVENNGLNLHALGYLKSVTVFLRGLLGQQVPQHDVYHVSFYIIIWRSLLLLFVRCLSPPKPAHSGGNDRFCARLKTDISAFSSCLQGHLRSCLTILDSSRRPLSKNARHDLVRPRRPELEAEMTVFNLAQKRSFPPLCSAAGLDPPNTALTTVMY
jgi:hypothetical protein